VRVTGDETWFSFVDVETNELSKKPFTKQAEKLKQTLSAFQKADGNCFLGQERSVDGGIHARMG
jgi:hypothetical protein